MARIFVRMFRCFFPVVSDPDAIKGSTLADDISQSLPIDNVVVFTGQSTIRTILQRYLPKRVRDGDAAPKGKAQGLVDVNSARALTRHVTTAYAHHPSLRGCTYVVMFACSKTEVK